MATKIKLMILFMFYSCCLYAQIDIESAKFSKYKEGISGKGEVFYNLNDGNSKQYKFGSLFKIGYLINKFETFILLNYEKSRANDKLVTNKGYAHLRLMLNLNNYFTLELFSQKEFNDFTKLKSRSLFGSGIRYDPRSNINKNDSNNYNLSFGSGFMYENEIINYTIKSESNLIRSTNYVNFQWKPNLSSKIMTITYLQFDINNFNDFRILNNTSFVVSIAKFVNLFISLGYRFDNIPPIDVLNYDFEMKNGLIVEF